MTKDEYNKMKAAVDQYEKDASRKKFSFSKMLLVAVSILNLAITVFALVMMWRTGDLSPLAYMIPSGFAELATATGFYYNKAKRENEIKLRSTYGPEVYNDSKEGAY